MRPTTLGGAVLGGAIGALPGALLIYRVTRDNPWFADEPLSLFLVAILAPALVGALVGALRGARNRAPDPQRLLKIGLPAAALPLVLAAMGFTVPRPGPVDARLVVVGVDGATFHLIDRLDLPHMRQVEQNGVRAELTSREPMFSPLLWTTMATGMTPEVHGIQGFRVQSDQARAARFWEIAHDQGLRVGMYKWLVTWPPTPMEQSAEQVAIMAEGRADADDYRAAWDAGHRGFIVPAWLAPGPETWPAELSFIKEIELSRRLKRKKYAGARPGWKLAIDGAHHGLRWSTLRQAAAWTLRERFTRPRPEERAWRLQLLRAAMDRDVFIAALHQHRPDLASLTLYATDALGHTHWGFMEDCATGRGPCDDLADALPAAYRQADAILGEILDSVGPHTRVLVVSDHGFRAMGPEDAGRFFAPKTERLKARLEAEVGRVDVSKGGHKITVALLEEDVEAEKARLIAFLDGLIQESTGQPFYRYEDIPDAPSAVGLTMADERVDEERLRTDRVGGEPLSDYARLTEEYSGEHDAAGIFLATGPGLPRGERLDPIPLLDLAPTMLALLDLPAAEDMPGRSVFGERHPRVATWSTVSPAAHGGHRATGDAEVNTEALKALGYIDE
ncbi:MAG: hypothetical protein D6798_02365 [Deltaproteobacteria bacterium]|nr:MAG: hypothetical protein D6798_02365 [Deltaproteobacteria bacterium]